MCLLLLSGLSMTPISLNDDDNIDQFDYSLVCTNEYSIGKLDGEVIVHHNIMLEPQEAIKQIRDIDTDAALVVVASWGQTSYQFTGMLKIA